MNPPLGSRIAARMLLCAALVTPLSATCAEPPGDLSAQAKKAADNGKYQDAAALYTKAIERSPANAGLLAERGVAYVNLNNLAAATADFAKALRLDPHCARAYYGRGSVLLLQGRLDKAIADLDESIRLDSHSSHPFSARGLAHLQQGQIDKAIGDLNQAIRLAPKDAEMLLIRAAAYMAHSAGHTFHQQRCPALGTGSRWAVSMPLDGSYPNTADLDKALLDINAAIRLDPKGADAFNDRGWLYALRKEYDKAIADFSEAIRLDPHHTTGLRNRSALYWFREERAKAMADANELVRLDPRDPNALLNRSSILFDRGDFEEGLKDLREAIRLDPKCADGYYRRATACLDAGRYRLAADDLTKAIELRAATPAAKPADYDAELRFLRGIAYYALVHDARNAGPRSSAAAGALNGDEKRKAVEDLRAAIRLDADLLATDATRAEHFFLASYDDALERLDEINRTCPKVAEFHYFRGAAHQAKGDTEAALADFTKAIQLDPKLAEAYVRRGYAFYHQGDFAKALADFNRAVELLPDHAAAYLGRADALDRLGKKAEAAKARAAVAKRLHRTTQVK